MQKAGTLGPGFCLVFPFAHGLPPGAAHSVCHREGDLSFCLLTVLWAKEGPGGCDPPQDETESAASLLPGVCCVLCPLSSGKSLALTCLPQALTMLEQEGY